MAAGTKFHSSFQSYSSVSIRNAVLAEILKNYPELEFVIHDDSCTFSEESSSCRYTRVPQSLEEIIDAICDGCGDVEQLLGLGCFHCEGLENYDGVLCGLVAES